MLDEYRNGNVISWLDFFLKGIVRVAGEAIETSNMVIDLREKDLHKVSGLGRASRNAIVLLKNLYKIPIINVRKIQEVIGLSREAANELTDRFVKMGILVPKDKGKRYGRLFVYKDYLNLFEEKGQ
jgi:Fic family protein